MLDGMTVAGFWPALWSSVIIGVAGAVGNALFGQSGGVKVHVQRGPQD
jgi:uncharacterized membrane protein YvlD (DUF360 family)